MAYTQGQNVARYGSHNNRICNGVGVSDSCNKNMSLRPGWDSQADLIEALDVCPETWIAPRQCLGSVPSTGLSGPAFRSCWCPVCFWCPGKSQASLNSGKVNHHIPNISSNTTSGGLFSAPKIANMKLSLLSNPGIVVSNVKLGIPGIWCSTTYLKMSDNVAPQTWSTMGMPRQLNGWLTLPKTWNPKWIHSQLPTALAASWSFRISCPGQAQATYTAKEGPSKTSHLMK